MARGARGERGGRAQRRGLAAEARAARALEADGWEIIAQRLRTPAGEIDLVAERDGLLAFVEVKARASLAGAAASLSLRQRARLIAAAETALAAWPMRGARGVRFDVIVVDDHGRMRRIMDAFREERGLG